METNGPSAAVGHEYFIISVCECHVDESVAVVDVDCIDTVRARAAVFFQTGLLDHAAFGGEYDVMCAAEIGVPQVADIEACVYPVIGIDV